MLDLAAIPVFDNHCHPLSDQFQELTLEQMGCLLHFSPQAGRGQSNAFSVATADMLGALGEFLACSRDASAILQARNERAKIYDAYIRDLFSDVGIELLLVDTGYPRRGAPDFAAFKRVASVPVERIFRVESLFAGYQEGHDTLLLSSRPPQSFSCFLERYIHELTQAVEDGAVAIKTILAYTTGLAVERVSYAEVKQDYEAYLRGDIGREKRVRDFLFVVTAEVAARHNMPLQVHTGHIGSRRPWPQANPILLLNALDDDRCRQTTFVLLHGGYPFTAEACYLASAFPNIYLDISLTIPSAPVGTERCLAGILESVPFDKVLYGSDGSAQPEVVWMRAKIAKATLGAVFERLVRNRVLTVEAACQGAELVLSGNAQRLYGCSAGSSSPLRSAREVRR